MMQRVKLESTCGSKIIAYMTEDNKYKLSEFFCKKHSLDPSGVYDLESLNLLTNLSFHLLEIL